jgi:hypothetical protein
MAGIIPFAGKDIFNLIIDRQGLGAAQILHDPAHISVGIDRVWFRRHGRGREAAALAAGTDAARGATERKTPAFAPPRG